MNYIYPEVSTTNFGDYIIDAAVRHLLSKHLPPPVSMCNPHAGHFPAGEHDCLLIPGITHITAGAVPGLEGIANLHYPTFCLSGSIWQPLPDPGLLLRTRVILKKPSSAPDLSMVRRFAEPIGARDPFTHDLLTRSGIQSIYTGCATILVPPDDVADDGYILFSFGRGHVRAQSRAARRLAQRHHVVGVCHEIGDLERYRAAGCDLPLVSWNGDTQLYLSYFKRSRMIVTGRLHGALPGLAYGKRVFYFGTRDSRTTILDDLGVPIHDLSEIDSAVDRASNAFNRAVLDMYRTHWAELIDQILERVQHGRFVNESRPVHFPKLEALAASIH